MKKIGTKLPLFIFVGIIFLITSFVFLTVKNSKGCNQLVIDTYEIHSGIDIPKVTAIDCFYDEDKEIRLSVYKVTDNMHISDFILLDYSVVKNKLEGINHFSVENLESSQKIQYKSGIKYGHEWSYAYSPETKILIAELKF